MSKYERDEYNYTLPTERIAKYPLARRGDSRLLSYIRGQVQHFCFSDFPRLIPTNSQLFYNNSRVIQARLFFRNKTGKHIEAFLLHPASPNHSPQEELSARKNTTWVCLIPSPKSWKIGEFLNHVSETKACFRACRVGTREVSFHWETEESFQELTDRIGQVPLPPYLGREEDVRDRENYQTTYAQSSGAVACPTAGLHFTDQVWHELAQHHPLNPLTLHVGGGSFLPVKEKDIRNHTMHEEWISIPRKTIDALLSKNLSNISVGTTTLRALESLYWYGAILEGNPKAPFKIPSDVYTNIKNDISLEKSLDNVLKNMGPSRKELMGKTRLFIHPPYHFRVSQGLLSNFHQPGSTLLMLIAAWVGGGQWRPLYEEAIQKGYRFLSYGDACFFLR
ncbi:MAG: S-adenosylmethionine:tRNA ribosyltransferase-isomerase [Cytophagales bacterium]|nr:S-adenosylmethionine:tRNA ribosyltransferase-isomerase [Cytophagales bacterium]